MIRLNWPAIGLVACLLVVVGMFGFVIATQPDPPQYYIVCTSRSDTVFADTVDQFDLRAGISGNTPARFGYENGNIVSLERGSFSQCEVTKL